MGPTWYHRWLWGWTVIVVFFCLTRQFILQYQNAYAYSADNSLQSAYLRDTTSSATVPLDMLSQPITATATLTMTYCPTGCATATLGQEIATLVASLHALQAEIYTTTLALTSTVTGAPHDTRITDINLLLLQHYIVLSNRTMAAEASLQKMKSQLDEIDARIVPLSFWRVVLYVSVGFIGLFFLFLGIRWLIISSVERQLIMWQVRLENYEKRSDQRLKALESTTQSQRTGSNGS